MVREFEEPPGNNLLVIVDPAVPADSSHNQVLLDDVISFAATLSIEWPKQNGGRFLLVVANDDPVVFEENSRFEHAISILECLAIQSGLQEARSDLVLDRLSRKTLPPGALFLLSVSKSSLGDKIAARLNRPVTQVTARDLRNLEFYKLPDVLLSAGLVQD